MHLKSFFMQDQDLFMQHCQSHCSWWPGDVRSQCISSPGQQQKSSAVIQYKDVILVWTFQYRKSHCGDKTVLELSISTMGFPLLVRQHLYVESGPRNPEQNSREHQAITWSYVDLLSVGSIDNTLAMLFLNENDMFKLIIIITEFPKRKYGNSLYKQLYKCLNNKFLSCWQLVSSR